MRVSRPFTSWVGVLSLALSLTISLTMPLTSCQSKENTLTVAATPVPQAEILEAVRPALEKQGIRLKIVEVDDYNLPNRLLYEKQVDANFFQHQPYLDEQNQRFGYDLVALTTVHIEPLGIYSKKITSLDALKEGAIIALPSDCTNEARALGLLEDLGLIKLKEEKRSQATIYDIVENPKNIKFEEIDAAFMPCTLADVDAALIPANYALQAHLNPLTDALALEPSNSPYANIVAIGRGDEGREDLQKLKQVITSEEMRAFILKKYHGALTPAF